MHQAFAYLNVDHPVVAWAVYRGTLVSAAAVDSAAADSARPVSMMFAGMIQHQANARFQNELLIDSIRRQRHADQVSRLAGMYFWVFSRICGSLPAPAADRAYGTGRFLSTGTSETHTPFSWSVSLCC